MYSFEEGHKTGSDKTCFRAVLWLIISGQVILVVGLLLLFTMGYL